MPTKEQEEEQLFLDEMHILEEELTEIFDEIDFPSLVEETNRTFATVVFLEFLLSSTTPLMSDSEESMNFFDELDELKENYRGEDDPFAGVTHSHFFNWMIYDAKDTNGLTPADLFIKDAEEKADTEGPIEEVRQLMNTRLGIYVVTGSQNGNLLLREVVTDRVREVMFPSDFDAEEEEMILARIAPALYEGDCDVSMAVPYWLVGQMEERWLEFFEEQGITKGAPDAEEKLHRFMKEGLTPTYWLDYIELAFEDYQLKAYEEDLKKEVDWEEMPFVPLMGLPYELF